LRSRQCLQPQESLEEEEGRSNWGEGGKEYELEEKELVGKDFRISEPELGRRTLFRNRNTTPKLN